MALRLVTPPSITPVTLAEAKAHLRVDSSDEDAVITIMIETATAHVDGPNGFLGRALVDQTWELVLDAFPPAPNTDSVLNQIKIPIPPLIEVVNITYDNTAGMPTVYPSTSYTVDTVSEPGWVVPASSWPATFVGINSVRIQFRAGYINLADSPPIGFIPADIKGAILLYIGALYANRDEVSTEGRVPVELPWGADRLLRRRRIELSMA
jgi:uncharacterized phiE125 gp8 family phage protein